MDISIYTNEYLDAIWQNHKDRKLPSWINEQFVKPTFSEDEIERRMTIPFPPPQLGGISAICEKGGSWEVTQL